MGFARNGANVVVAARTKKVRDPNLPGTIYDTVKEIESSGGRALPLQCDVTNEDSVRNMVEKTQKTFGRRIDILVNNAGVAFYYPLVETPLKRWNLVLNVNITGVFLCTKTVLGTMIEQQSGCIINLSSLAANERDQGTVATGLAYGVAKAGVERFTWGLASEVGRHNIRVNCIKPARVVDTEGMRYWVPEEERKGWVTEEKLVRCAVFLAGSDQITGVVATDEELCAWYGL
jgi:NAD(P)-dependent dehydrogenase (short-subunit alcohol dehydrogenase family)